MFYRADLTGDNSGSVSEEPVQREVVHPYDANLISSQRSDNTHALLLDLDIEHFYVQSTSNHHLMLNTNLSDDALKEVVDVLVKHGILQEGIKRQLERDGHLSLRMPGMIKGEDSDLSLEAAKVATEQYAKAVEGVNEDVLKWYPAKYAGAAFQWSPAAKIEGDFGMSEITEKFEDIYKLMKGETNEQD